MNPPVSMLLLTKYKFTLPLVSLLLSSILPNTAGNIGAISNIVEAECCSVILTTSNISEFTVIISLLVALTPFSLPIVNANIESFDDTDLGADIS